MSRIKQIPATIQLYWRCETCDKYTPWANSIYKPAKRFCDKNCRNAGWNERRRDRRKRLTSTTDRLD